MSKGSTQSARKEKRKAILSITRHQAADKIVDLLNRASYGYNYMQFFEMFVEAAHLCIDELPHFAEQAVAAARSHMEGGPPPDTRQVFTSSAEGLEKWRAAGLHEISAEQYETFADCFWLLLDHSWMYNDVIGECYMRLKGESRWNNDEFYTPDSVAICMARMSLHDVQIEERFIAEARRIFDNDADMQERFRAIIEADPAWALPQRFEAIAEIDPGLVGLLKLMNLTLGGGDLSDATYDRFLTEIFALVLPRMKPFTIQDPCVGSGVLLLAAAQCCPRWLIDIGYIQFFGQDLRHLPVRMCQLNMKLNGLGHRAIKPATALSMMEIMRMRQPFKEVYQKAKTPEFMGGGVTEEEAERFAGAIEASGDHQLDLRMGKPIGDSVDKEKIAHAVKQRRRKADPATPQTLSLFDMFDKESEKK